MAEGAGANRREVRRQAGRKRDRLKKRKFPLLVAYGVDPVSGERWVLDWQRAGRRTWRAGGPC